jgi:AcrR family transcriptional regulator
MGTPKTRVDLLPGDVAVENVSSRQRMTQAERTALSDNKMFDAALDLINERGTHNTTLKEIGERAGYSRGLASSRFGSKEQLFNELVAHIQTRWKADSVPRVQGKKGISSLLASIDGIVKFLTTDERYVRAMYILYYETIGSSDLIRQRIARRHLAYRRGVAKWISQGIEDGTIRDDADPEKFAVQFLAFYYGTIYLWLVAPQSVDFAQVFQDYRDSAIVQLLMRKKNARV